MFFEKKIHLEEFTRFRSFFTVCKGVVNIKPGYCYYWIFKQIMISFMIATGSLNGQDMISIVKQSGHDFSRKHSCNGYCMDFIWCLCLEFSIQQRVLWFCEKPLT